MTDQSQKTNSNEYMYYPEDEKDLIDHLLVIWKWKHLIIAGTLAFVLVSVATSFIPPKKYFTNILLKPGISELNKSGEAVFISSPKNIKTLIEGNLKYRVLDYIKNSDNKNLSTSLEFKVDLDRGSNIVDVGLISAYSDQDKVKLNYLVRALSDEFTDKIRFFQEELDKEIELKKTELINLIPIERKTKVEDNKSEQLKKDNVFDLMSEEQNIKEYVYYILNRNTELELKIKLITDSNDWLIKKIDILKKDNNQDTTLPIFLCSRTIMENISSEEIYRGQIESNYKKLEKIIKIEKEIEFLKKKKLNIQNIQVIQPPVTTDLPKTDRGVLLSTVLVFFILILLAFFIEYLKKNKEKLKKWA